MGGVGGGGGGGNGVTTSVHVEELLEYCGTKAGELGREDGD